MVVSEAEFEAAFGIVFEILFKSTSEKMAKKKTATIIGVTISSTIYELRISSVRLPVMRSQHLPSLP